MNEITLAGIVAMCEGVLLLAVPSLVGGGDAAVLYALGAAAILFGAWLLRVRLA